MLQTSRSPKGGHVLRRVWALVPSLLLCTTACGKGGHRRAPVPTTARCGSRSPTGTPLAVEVYAFGTGSDQRLGTVDPAWRPSFVIPANLTDIRRCRAPGRRPRPATSGSAPGRSCSRPDPSWISSWPPSSSAAPPPFGPRARPPARRNPDVTHSTSTPYPLGRDVFPSSRRSESCSRSRCSSLSRSSRPPRPSAGPTQ